MAKNIFQIHTHGLDNYGVDEDGTIFDMRDNFKTEIPLEYDKKNKEIYFIHNGEKINAREIVMFKFYGELPNTKIEPIFDWKDISPYSMQYVIEDFQEVDDNTILINNNVFKRPNQSKYFVSEKGVIYNSANQKFILYNTNAGGYIKLVIAGQLLHLTYLHQVMWEAFKFPVEPGYDVHHKDCHNWNNVLDNFQYLSHEEHMKLHNMPLVTEQKVTDEMCKQMFEMKIAGKLNREIAETFDLPLNTVISITTGKKHKKIYEMYKDKLNTRRNLSFDEALDLAMDIKNGMGWSALMEKYKVGRRAIEKIKWGETHKQIRERFPELKTIKIPN